MSFATAIARVLQAEGGYVNDPADPGGETNFGITWPVLREAVALNIGVPAGTTIANLTVAQAQAIYYQLFWLKVDADQMPDRFAFQALDFAVNSGIHEAVLCLQRALGVAADGNWGPVTKAAATAANPAVLDLNFIAERLDFMRSLKNWPSAGRGWAGRISIDLRAAAQDLLAP
jgi:lysozyme family protein